MNVCLRESYLKVTAVPTIQASECDPDTGGGGALALHKYTSLGLSERQKAADSQNTFLTTAWVGGGDQGV